MLFALSLWLEDGMSLIATVYFSLVPSLTGICNPWTLKLPAQKPRRNAPSGDMVILYPQRSFLVVRCQEDVAREVFFIPNDMNYVVWSGLLLYRSLALLGAVTFMMVLFILQIRLLLCE